MIDCGMLAKWCAYIIGVHFITLVVLFWIAKQVLLFSQVIPGGRHDAEQLEDDDDVN